MAEHQISDIHIDALEAADDLRNAEAYDEWVREQVLRAWGDKEGPVVTRRTAWYDESDYVVPNYMGLTPEQFRSTLYDAWATRNTGWSVGGYSTPRVTTHEPGFLLVTTVYHIGD
jgi:hypothetical protein